MIISSKAVRVLLLTMAVGLLSSNALAFDAPADPRGTEVGQNLVKWEWEAVPEADVYEVVLDGLLVDTIASTEYFSPNLWAGEHSLTIRGRSSDGENSERTPTIKIIVRDQFIPGTLNRSFFANAGAPPALVDVNLGLFPPQNLRGTVTQTGDIRWEWDSVTGASSYEVTVDGNYVGATNDLHFTSYRLWVGEHSMTATAVDFEGNKSEQSVTVKLWVDGSTVEEEVVPVDDTPIVIAPVVPPIDNEKQNVDLYLLSGQSNANSETFYFLGFTLSFYYHDYPDDYAVAHWNMGGATINQWIDASRNKGQNWLLMMEQLHSEAQKVLAAGKQIRSVNLLWIQGENDALDGTSNYEALFTALVESWKEEIAFNYGVPAYVSSGLPWVQECHSLWDAYFKDGIPTIRQAQQNVANRFPYVATWETSDIYRGDCVHIGDHWLSTARAMQTAIDLREANQ